MEPIENLIDFAKPFSVRYVNKIFRNVEKSQNALWPVRNRFNLAERAIRKAKRLINDDMIVNSNLEYILLLDQIAGEIVNNPKNW